MILLEWCGRCMVGAGQGAASYDVTPDPACRLCAGSGYVGASRAAIRRYWLEVQEQLPRPISRALVGARATG